ncbi:carbohydrate ABC transporter substrate-binding protein (CUT1 family) [Kribbella amoyensis]|uniref:Carbohydrate ABC transporter substrate-binding protein (CUT1 family) n=1 Tax=Kribbella amoyensis TaxID=996641 RepID=A0A561B8P8_9ACTN|nr:sugar ABC transporter substrate-binding protein [Kribbella amoyensis]TWD75346.1 carbohydrate ABC transporter substrate-binding protein (CUT1 family) [Kribbella amoyensis]
MRIPSVVAGLVLAATALTACGGGTDQAGDTKVPDDPSQVKGDITYAIWDVNQQPAMQEIVKAFNAKYPNVKVSISLATFDQYFTKLKTQGTSDNLPDVFWMNGPNFQLFAANDQLAKLDGLTEAKQLDPANYPKALNDLYTLDGTQYGVPKDYDTVALWYNKKLFADAKVQPPTADWTWDDYKAAAAKLKAALGPKGIFATGDTLGNQADYYPAMLSNGGYVIKDGKSGYGDPKSVEALQFWSDMVKNGYTPTAAQNAETKSQDRFFDGKAAMMWNGNWVVSAAIKSQHKDDFTVVPLPKAPGGERKTVIHGIANVMSAKTKNPEASAAFLAFLGGKDAALIQAKAGAANPAFTGTQGDFVNSVPGYNLKTYIEAAEQYAEPYPVSKDTAVWNKLETDQIAAAFGGDKPMSEIGPEVAKQMDEALGKEK